MNKNTRNNRSAYNENNPNKPMDYNERNSNENVRRQNSGEADSRNQSKMSSRKSSEDGMNNSYNSKRDR